MTRFYKRLIAGSTLLGALLMASSAFAQARDAATLDRDKWIALAAGLGLGLAAFGGALGQGRAAASALEAISRNPDAQPKLFTTMIIGLALIESLVIYSLLISLLLYFKL